MGGSYLILDEYWAQMCSSVVKPMNVLGTDVEFIPGGYTSKLQVLDIDIEGERVL